MNQNTEQIIKPETEILTRNSFRRSNESQCFICQKTVKLLTFLQAAELFGTGIEQICRLSEKKDLHLLHNRKGIVMVCSDSVIRFLNRRQMMISNPQIILVKPLTGEKSDENSKTERNNY